MYSWLKRFANGETCEDISDIQKEKWIKRICSKECVHMIHYIGGDYVCEMCGQIFDNLKYIPETEGMMSWWPRNYTRITYFKNLFDKILGLEEIYLPLYFLIELENEIPNPGNWYQVYQVYKKFDLKNWWIAWNKMKIINRSIDMNPSHYQTILYVDDKWNNSTRAKKKLNVFYMLFKIVELSGHNTDWVPFKLRSVAIIRLDLEWKNICEKFNWNFIPTSKSLKNIQW